MPQRWRLLAIRGAVIVGVWIVRGRAVINFVLIKDAIVVSIQCVFADRPDSLGTRTGARTKRRSGRIYDRVKGLCLT